MARHPRWVRGFLAEADLDAVTRAIGAAELRTSAEIRVHLDHRCPGEPMARAVAVFEHLGMHRTAARHGVLIYVSVGDHKLAVLGDQGIHERVGQVYWERLVDAVLAHFREERPRDGLLHAVAEVGAVLARHFPRRPGDVNELSDQVSIDP
ncbi:MAG TPA: TPM domain-containing protein [Methylomirabilota bacterium]|jgi:uncharacterized membrane protein|nr:TPM domain-containing protein [Methylomirabilota bacterium]